MQLAMHMVTIEDLMPREHFLRKLEAALDLSFVYEETAPLYSKKYGRPGHRPGGHREVPAGGVPVRHPVGAADRATRPDRHRPALVPGPRPLRPGAGSQHRLAAAPPEAVLPQGISAII